MEYKNKREYEKASAEALEMLRKIDFIIRKQRESNLGMEMFRKVSDEKKEGKLTKSISKVEFPKDGGIISYFSNEEYPMKGFSCSETVENVDEMKKQGMALLKRLKGILSGNKVKATLFYLVFRKQINEVGKGFIESLWFLIRRYKSKPFLYCKCVREVYRVFNIFILIEKEDSKEILAKIRDLTCMTLEFDDAYRYRFQDILSEVNIEQLKKDPVKELNRLLDILISRDESLKEKWQMVQKFVHLIRFKKDLRVFITRFIDELNMDEIRMDELDLYHCETKQAYLWPKKRKNNIKTEC
jgi:hypothetical protein